MTTGIAGSSSQPHVAGLPPNVPDSVADELTQAVAAEDRLASEALERFGEHLPARTHPPLHQDFSDEMELGLTRPARRPVHVPVGTGVTVSPTEPEWYVIGTRGDSVRLAQRNLDDSGFRTTSRTWASLVERNPQLLDAPFVDATGQRWIPMSTEGVDILGRSTPIPINRLDEIKLRYLMGMTPPPPVITTWDDVLRGTELTRRRPIAAAPRDFIGAAQLRDVLGDDKIVLSHVGEPYGLRGVLVGTDSSPGRAGDIFADAKSMQDWFHAKVGIDVWGPEHNAIFMTDSKAHLANAAAAAVGDDALVYEGPRSARVSGSWLSEMSGPEGQYVRRFSKMIHANDLAVRTHEAGHVATMRTWGRADERITDAATTIAQHAEDGIVQEAMSDLLGAARTGKPTVGVRDLQVLKNGWADLDQLRAGLATMTPEMLDVHSGTQLLTKPMAKLLELHGGDQLAEVTGAAIKDIGQQVKGGAIQAIDLPTAAKALRDATAWRHGADSEIVSHLDDVWKTLGLLR
ncbi:MAG: hypothetical protein JWL76_216 [Thermoleophilia bacterium]|nr:hypothetical protein [Thermoleophilia bacterium]